MYNYYQGVVCTLLGGRLVSVLGETVCAEKEGKEGEMNMKKTIKYLATLMAAALAAHCLFVPSAPDRTVAASATGAGRVEDTM